MRRRDPRPPCELDFCTAVVIPLCQVGSDGSTPWAAQLSDSCRGRSGCRCPCVRVHASFRPPFVSSPAPSRRVVLLPGRCCRRTLTAATPSRRGSGSLRPLIGLEVERQCVGQGGRS